MKDKHPLYEKRCIACKGGDPPLDGHRCHELLKELDPSWKLDGHLHREWRFRNFAEAWNCVDTLAEIAEKEGHHPELLFSWGKVEARIWTHKINGLTESDFILAAKYDHALEKKP